MTRKKWITLGIVVMASALLMVTVVATSAAQSSEAGVAALGANESITTEGPDGSLAIAASSPVSTSFTYQGQLKDGGGPVDGDCQMAFRLYDEVTGGSQVGSDIITTVPVNDGLFTVNLDFGSGAFAGDARWLRIRVQCPGDTGYTTLSPRQPLTAVPYALYTLQAPWSGLTGVPTGFADGVDNNTTYSAGTGLTLSGTQFRIAPAYRLPQSCGGGQIAEWNGSAWACGDDDTGGGGTAWLLTGNAGTTPGTHFLGTTDGVSLTLAVSGTAALRLEPNGTSPNLIGGYSGNWVADGVVGATIGGGGELNFANRVTSDYGTVAGGVNNEASNSFATVGGGDDNQANGSYAVAGGGYFNRIGSDYATVSGGQGNNIGDDSNYATIGGGRENLIGDTTRYATIDGGVYNDIGIDSDRTAIGGGYDNDIGDNSQNTVIGGGWDNDVGDNTWYATTGGGYENVVGDDSDYATIGGGRGNEIWDGVAYSIIGGGHGNIISDTITNYATISGGRDNIASLEATTVGGGRDNTAFGNYATVGGGRDNIANHDYSTVPGGRYNHAQGPTSFAAGYRAKAWHTGSFVWADSSEFDFESTASDQFSARTTGGARFVLSVNSSGNPNWTCSAVSGSSWSCSSDRNLKENLILADGSDVVERVSQMPVYYWTGKGHTTPHIGPMAQDFYAAFGVGDSDVAIATIDLDGVALAAIQGLYEQNVSLQEKSVALETENANLHSQMADLEARVAALESGSAPAQVSQPNPLLWLGLILVGAGMAWAFRRRDGLRSINGGGR